MLLMERKLYSLMLLISVAVFLNACGSENDSSNNQTSTPIAINSQNARAIADIYLNNQFEELTTSINETGNAPPKSLLAKSKSLQYRAVSTTDPIPCDSGSYIFDGDVATGIGTYVYDNCTTNYFGGYTETENGNIIVSGIGSLHANVFDGVLNFDNYTLTSENPVSFEKFEGKIFLAYNLDSIIQTYKMSGESLSIEYNDDTFSLNDYLMSYALDTAVNIETFESNYTFESSLLNGFLKLETLKPLKAYTDQLYPFEGVLLFTGANNSQLKIIVIEGGVGALTDSVQIQVDAGGDGIFEYDIVDTWGNLASGNNGTL